jgi:hypothetical protein
VIGVIGGAAATAAASETDVARLHREWAAAEAAWEAEQLAQENSPAALALNQKWTELERQIAATPAVSADDIRLKMAFYRNEVGIHAEAYACAPDIHMEYLLLAGIFADVERMLAGGVA